MKGPTYLISWILLEINLTKFFLFIFVMLELQAAWKEDYGTLTNFEIRYYINEDFME